MHKVHVSSLATLLLLLTFGCAGSVGAVDTDTTTTTAAAAAASQAYSQSELESGKVPCTDDSPKYPFTALGLPTTLSGEQGPPQSLCECSGGHYYCWGAYQAVCKSTVVIDENVVTPTDEACPNAEWMGHGGESGKDWVWCCS